MKKIPLLTLLMFFMLFALISCRAGGGSLASGGAELRCFWPISGRDRYQAVVYPASISRPAIILVQRKNWGEVR